VWGGTVFWGLLSVTRDSILLSGGVLIPRGKLVVAGVLIPPLKQENIEVFSVKTSEHKRFPRELASLSTYYRKGQKRSQNASDSALKHYSLRKRRRDDKTETISCVLLFQE